uniref:Uncharacterized protein n=1 Tax=Arundo donax TaxID=35708 RepID=A0A0A8YVT1_ARUDO
MSSVLCQDAPGWGTIYTAAAAAHVNALAPMVTWIAGRRR